MKNYLEHPAEEVLERFLLHGSDEQELEVIETHILACDSCVARLESLEVEIAATKLALQNVRLEAAARSAQPQTAGWKAWFAAPALFSAPKWSVAGACAALALGILVTPQLMHRLNPAEEVNLVAYRGLEAPVLPKDRRLHVNLNARELPQADVNVDLVNSDGVRTWHGTTKVHDDLASVTVSPISKAGEYYFRLTTPTPAGEGETLREFAVQVK